nr:alcohol dehydrogenase catalytic domain-containing protein [Vulcanisaeta sp. JCM 16159]
MKVKAAILQEFGKPLKIGYVDIPEPGDDESVLIKIIGAGMCKTDIRLWKGEEPREGFRAPFVLGHENAGIVEAIGKRVKGISLAIRSLFMRYGLI